MATATITAKLGLDGRGFRAGLQSAENSAKRFTRNLGGYFAGAFTIGAVTQQIKKAIDEASRINDMSRSLGLGVEQFQELEFAAKQTGTSMEAVGMAIKKLAQAQQEALTTKGGGKAGESFERLGVTMAQLRASTPQELFKQIAASVQAGNIGVQNMADILDLMGKQANTLLPAMQEGFAGMAAQAQQMGLIIGEDVISRLDDMGDQLDIIRTKWAVLRAESIITGNEMLTNLWQNLLTEYSMFTEFMTGGMEKARQAREAIAELVVEEEANTREQMATRKSARAKALLGIAPGDIFKPQAAVEKAAQFKPASDALARIGGFVGGAGRNRGIEIAEKQLKKLDSIEDYVRRVVFGVL